MPIGIQDFEDLRRNAYLYVDKTAYVWKLVTEGKPYFLSRPRRFGKSLLLTTLKAYFLGKKELFEGLTIAKLETEWREYPVLHLDFNSTSYTTVEKLNEFLNYSVDSWEKAWGLETSIETAALRFKTLIERLYQKTGVQAVVLVDEYDKPLLESMGDEKLNAALRAELKPFYGVLKSADAVLRFVMLTGVTRFSKVSIFSDLNQLNEIGLSRDYAGICGITENELISCFTPELNALAAENGENFEETLKKMRGSFNGYRFARDSESVYNPFSVLNTFNKREIQYYWFATGTPTFLFGELKRTGFDITRFDNKIEIDEFAINDYQSGDANPVPLLYQSGYLTITDFDKNIRLYRLGFPNEEVKYGFLANLFKYFFPDNGSGNGLDARTFVRALNAGDAEIFLGQLKAFFAAIPYDLYFAKGESYYQTIFYLVFTLMGQFVRSEVRSAAGRADAVVMTAETVYVFEFKVDGSAEEALRQIDDKGYMIPYSADGRRLVKAGVVFDSEKRTLGEWRLDEPPFS
jgi:hypothetical protein